MKITFGLKKILGREKEGLLREKWKFDSKNTLLAPPTICDLKNTGEKNILFGTKEGKIYSLDKNSNIKWIFDAQEQVDQIEIMFLDVESANSIQASPNIYDLTGDGRKEIVFGTEMGVVYALNSEGKPVWKFKAEGSIRGGVIIKDVDGDGKPEVIFGSGDKNLYILNAKGKLINKFEVDESIESMPEVMDDKIIFGTNNGKIHCISFEGEEIWTFKTKDKVLAQPVIGKLFGGDERYIIIGSTDQYLYTLDEQGALIWKFKTEGAIYSKAALADINNDKKLEIIFGSCDNKVYAVDSRGEKMWSYETNFWIVAPVIVSDIDDDGNLEIIAGSYDHNLYVLDAKGNYILDYVPGLAGVMQQTGSYSDITTSEAGKMTGKKIWQYQTEGIIVGCAMIDETKDIIINTQKGYVNNIGYEKKRD
ncbi:MAG: PQQ-binding-like beta-propeller repeat protein [Nanoarchaeota archaeon]|nr:PQQ-binding-like beta-propeller repeat protein [Nanoarchaeota archaeon]MBU1269724.1 PQQ-binding-like beta-propeller repeat protein [Nanoarchaeota archaeon]MBU1604025.1 PQQ-binding-like beta-propeller repeat protein [Nanoarchaeota archaeon]MBU2443611.1 PQQ-binding-like beta-propeller repeat protein [Nanoarchaeota archaeon]